MLHTIIEYCKKMYYKSIQRARHSALCYLRSIDVYLQNKSKRMEQDARRYHANSNVCVWNLEKEA